MNLLLLLSFCAAAVTAAEGPQWPMHLLEHIENGAQFLEEGPKKIAIVGGGIAAASLAYTLYTDSAYRQPVDLTIYEAAHGVGGRVNSTLVNNLANTYGGFVDTGASTFSDDDWCLQSAIDDVGLRKAVIDGVHSIRLPTAGVWDGQTFIRHRDRARDIKSRTVLEYGRDILKYGLSARRLQNIMRTKLPLFGDLRSIPYDIQQLDLEEESKMPANEYLIQNGVSAEVMRDIVEPTARALFAHNLTDLNGLSALIAMNPAATHRLGSIPRGNMELVSRLVRLSEARTFLNTHVSKISSLSNGKYLIAVSDTDHVGKSEAKEDHEYDIIVIATHLQGAGIEFDFPTPPLVKSLPDFVERHVTHFTTHRGVQLAPSFFNLTTSDKIPDMIFTNSQSPISNETDVFAIEHYDTDDGFHGDLRDQVHLYKVISSKTITDSLILQMLGKSPDSSLASAGVKWTTRQVWPLASPKHTTGPQLDHVELTKGLFYTGLSDELLNSMEMSCRMGRQVAGLVFKRLLPCPHFAAPISTPIYDGCDGLY
ncbi:uncharacterized protein K441DRAFT_681711 [Cenococcum geophilum 1.58]|uniref:uncharacterized protein n=1 Tax=Cenococcum geophilum 1.58 TaxID=794803 RepID=UPI0035901AB0|nr:hypothetical protein K441DRAFT_681711 [Cenococcum geophilum 1.58]